jgi:uroporphyrinogen-III synthase
VARKVLAVLLALVGVEQAAVVTVLVLTAPPTQAAALAAKLRLQGQDILVVPALLSSPYPQPNTPVSQQVRL